MGGMAEQIPHQERPEGQTKRPSSGFARTSCARSRQATTARGGPTRAGAPGKAVFDAAMPGDNQIDKRTQAPPSGPPDLLAFRAGRSRSRAFAPNIRVGVQYLAKHWLRGLGCGCSLQSHGDAANRGDLTLSGMAVVHHHGPSPRAGGHLPARPRSGPRRAPQDTSDHGCPRLRARTFDAALQLFETMMTSAAFGIPYAPRLDMID